MRCTHVFVPVVAMVVGMSAAEAQPAGGGEIGEAGEVAELEATTEDRPAPPTAALVRHVPPALAEGGSRLRLVAVIDDAWVEGGLVARYRPVGDERFAEAPFERSTSGGYFATIPAEAVRRPGLEYFIVGSEGETAHFASATRPHRVRVEPAPGRRWIEVERRRLGGRLHGVEMRFESQDFGSEHGADHYVRGEVEWGYRLVSTLYSIKVGYGFLDGVTPSGTEEDAVSIERGMRWGYGSARLRLRDDVWLDGKAMMGFGEEGFLYGVGGQLVLGNDWRTAVSIGAEAMTELSYRAWVELQWDTVPPFLMSAAAATTDQPGAEIDAGSYVAYEIAYPLPHGLTLAGSLRFGARGNRPGGFGAGLTTSYDF